MVSQLVELALAKEPLSPALATVSTGETTLRVYRAKGAESPFWVSEPLQQAVSVARTSYRKYFGETATLLDEYDQKSWVYLVVARSQVSALSSANSYFSVRFVPAIGLPAATEDLAFYTCRKAPDSPLADYLNVHLPGVERSGASANRFFSMSRMCSVHSATPPSSQSPTHTSLSWLMCLRQFLSDAPISLTGPSYLTTQMHQELAEKLREGSRRHGSQVPLSLATDLLKLPEDHIYLDQRVARVQFLRYGFPAYFLDVNDLSRLLETMVRRDIISEQKLVEHLPTCVSVSDFFSQPKLWQLRTMGSLLSHNGPIGENGLTGNELRALVDCHVGDGPKLHAIDLADLSVRLPMQHGQK